MELYGNVQLYDCATNQMHFLPSSVPTTQLNATGAHIHGRFVENNRQKLQIPMA